jgi:hypothetical protein
MAHKRRIGVGERRKSRFLLVFGSGKPLGRSGGGEVSGCSLGIQQVPEFLVPGQAGPALKLAPASPRKAGLGLLKDGLQVLASF